jgi:hypothetical protein
MKRCGAILQLLGLFRVV